MQRAIEGIVRRESTEGPSVGRPGAAVARMRPQNTKAGMHISSILSIVAESKRARGFGLFGQNYRLGCLGDGHCGCIPWISDWS